MRISILGCGWLGFPLAQELIREGHTVRGSVTSRTKLPELSSAGIDAFLIDLFRPDRAILQSFLKDTEILIFAVPPRSGPGGWSMIPMMEFLLEEVRKQRVLRVIYTSSIGVYSNSPDFQICVEGDEPEHPVGKAADLLQRENLFLEEPGLLSHVVRLGGLLGNDRHPVYYLAGKKNLPNPDAPVNLIHQEDCIQVILLLLNHRDLPRVLNAVHPFHPSRREYYTRTAKQMKLPKPQFSYEPSFGKTVSSEALEGASGYVFKAGI